MRVVLPTVASQLMTAFVKIVIPIAVDSIVASAEAVGEAVAVANSETVVMIGRIMADKSMPINRPPIR